MLCILTQILVSKFESKVLLIYKTTFALRVSDLFHRTAYIVECLEGHGCKVHTNTFGGSINFKWGPKSAISRSGKNIHAKWCALRGDRICRVNKVRLRGEAPGSFFYLPSTPLLWAVIINFQLRLCTRVCTFYRDQPVESREKRRLKMLLLHTQKTKSYPGLPLSSLRALLGVTFESR
jgi:hypothetical protein